MVLTISTTHSPASDLGFLVHKHPDRIHTGTTTFGTWTVAFPECGEARATLALFCEIDPIKLARGKERQRPTLFSYVNDRPYVASSFLSVALADAFGTALGGRSKDRQSLAETPIPLEVNIPVLPCRAGADRILALFEPLGYEVTLEPILLDEEFPEWSTSKYFNVHLTGKQLLRDCLRHLYILLPALDSQRHYYLDRGEIDKLTSKGEGWLPTHPEREWILRAALGRKPSLLREAMEQLANAEEGLLVDAVNEDEAAQIGAKEQAKEKPETLHTMRHDYLVKWIKEARPDSVLDLGCGEGKLMKKLVPINGLRRIVGMDVSFFELEKAARSLRLEDAAPALAERVQLIHGSLMYRDDRLKGFDVCTVVEVIEHLDPPRLTTFEHVVFKHAAPRSVLLTTPNREYNVVYEVTGLRHGDHRFEWDRAEFQAWASRVADEHGYSVTFSGIGEEHETYGFPSQVGVFHKCG